MDIKSLTEHHLEFLSLKGGCTGSSESINVKMLHCWNSHVVAQVKPMLTLVMLSIFCTTFLPNFYPVYLQHSIVSRVKNSVDPDQKLDDLDLQCFLKKDKSKFIKTRFKVSKGAKIRNQYNQVPHLTQDTNDKVSSERLEKQGIKPRPLENCRSNFRCEWFIHCITVTSASLISLPCGFN